MMETSYLYVFNEGLFIRETSVFCLIFPNFHFFMHKFKMCIKNEWFERHLLQFWMTLSIYIMQLCDFTKTKQYPFFCKMVIFSAVFMCGLPSSR